MSAEHFTLENRIQVCREYTKLWADYFKMFADSLEHRRIHENDEAAFQQIISLLALNHFKFTELMADKLKDPEDILEVLCESVSLSYLKMLSEAQFSKLQVDWHTLFLEMNKCLGKLQSELHIRQEKKRKK
jgi:hypothetical protein